MKTFEGENYYQILNIGGSASAIEIRRAYLDTLEIYKEDSIATYSLFSPDQRKILLQTIHQAFDTLMDKDKRSAYDQMLVDSGRVDSAYFLKQPVEKPVEHSMTQSISKEKSLHQWVQKKSDAPEVKSLVDGILSSEIVSGQDLKRIREAFGIEIHEINAITRVSNYTLNMIEADRYDDLPAEIYLKQFLKSYAEILHIDPQRVVNGYLKSIGKKA
jgi:curved DNA-binding protein CbpA